MKKFFTAVAFGWYFFILQYNGELKLSPSFTEEGICYVAYGIESATFAPTHDEWRVHYCWSDGRG